MKKFKLAVLLLLAVGATSFAQNQDVKKEASDVRWTGKKIGGSHTGEIEVKSGYLELKDGQISGGKVTMDMQSITNTDLDNAEFNQKLVNHLKSEDFFGVDQYPTSTFVVTKASKFENGKATVSGNLTIKGITKDMSFVVKKEGNKYSAEVEIDRSQFDVRYGSKSFFDNLGDKAINDIFILDITLVTKG